MTFTPFPKIPRLSREMIITEKIDGTNASIYIVDRATHDWTDDVTPWVEGTADFVMAVGSRTRWITPGKNDNAGFAGWCKDHASELFKLGPGHHFGEWWGKGIQRGYGMPDKEFSLFNTTRWNKSNIPYCVNVVPELYRGDFDTNIINQTVNSLRISGSKAVNHGIWVEAEGIVIYHVAANQLFKKTLKDDETPKGLIK